MTGIIQRFFDIIFSAIALFLLVPLLLPLIAILKFTGEGEIFYIQQRIGKNGMSFGLFKFATMLKNSPSLGHGDITVRNDPRVLPIGNLLRKTKLNELPQLINILNGDMSIVGPRPHTPKNYNLYNSEIKKIVNTQRPGLTGIGSIVFRDEESILENSENKQEFYANVIVPYKGELEKWYIENVDIIKYFMIIFLTAWYIFKPESRLVWSVFVGLPKPPAELKIR